MAGPSPRLTRRRLLQLGLALPLPLALAACDGDEPEPEAGVASTTPPSPSTAAAGGTLAPTPACDDGDDPTLSQTEGPFFAPDSPERASLLEPGLGGTRLTITGAVVDTGCRPVPRALLDFWQADDHGEYSHESYRLRGHQFTDAQGRWRLETIVPALYSGRTRHIHVKVQAPNRPVLTTQLYFPGEPANQDDRIFRRELLLEHLSDRAGGRQASFTFVLDL
ncbi:MAG TPA: hypothetical protein VGR68_12060 [Actinomycetota bacterium]|nr:hypothetical protein [Actinomycetota bacterium]